MVALLSPLAFTATYEFTEAELVEYTNNVVRDSFEKKDLEIAVLIIDYDLQLFDKDSIIEEKDIIIEADIEKISILKTTNEKQGKFLKWAPVVVVTTFVVGLISGIFTAGSL